MGNPFDAARIDESKKLKGTQGTESSAKVETREEKEQKALKSTDVYSYAGANNQNWGNLDGFERISVEQDEDEILNNVTRESKIEEGEEAMDGANEAIDGAKDKEKEADEANNHKNPYFLIEYKYLILHFRVFRKQHYGFFHMKEQHIYHFSFHVWLRL